MLMLMADTFNGVMILKVLNYVNCDPTTEKQYQAGFAEMMLESEQEAAKLVAKEAVEHLTEIVPGDE
jgi:hypothetical protein